MHMRQNGNMRLDGKVALVTGGGSGIGRAVAERFAAGGATVVLADVDITGIEEAACEIRTAGGEAFVVHTDVSKIADVQAMVSVAAERYGRIDVLFSSAAVQLIGQDGPAHELSEQAWDCTMAVNLRGLWLCSKYTVPVMLRQGGGSIIHVASPAGLRGVPSFTAYSASKGGVIALTRTMAAEYATRRIRVNAIVPSVTNTPLISKLLADEETRRRLTAMIPTGRMASPQEITGLALFLASDDSSFCTGGLYMVDGGRTAI